MIFFNKSEVGSRKSEVFHKKSHGLRPRISHGSEGDVLCGMCGIGKRGQMAEGRFARSQVAGRRSQGRIGKRGQMAEGIHMMYRLMMVSLVAFIVFSAGAFVYDYYIDVRDVEARILTREVVDCLVVDGVLDLGGELLDGCGFVKSERFYVGAEVRWQDAGGRMQVIEFSEGDKGALWIKDLFGKVGDATGSVMMGNAVKTVDNIIKYEPGYYEANYSVFVLDNNVLKEGVMKMEVLVNYGDE